MKIKNTSEWILSTFLQLTSKTYPYGTENGLIMELGNLFPQGLNIDQFGNYYYKIGESKTVFASHLDTACKDQKEVSHVLDNEYVRTDKTTILGADDKAGVTILLYMIENKIPGLYYFFIGEEVGCIGSGAASKIPEFTSYNKMISFDRRGTSSVITHQTYTRTCSDSFAVELSNQLNKTGMSFKKDDTGIYTDSAEFASIIPECTNISVGYYNEHTTNEHQDIDHLSKLAEVCLLVNWDNLPIVRNPSIIDINYGRVRTFDRRERESENIYNRSYGDFESARYNRKKKKNRPRKRSKRQYQEDLESDQTSREFYDMGNGEIEEINRIGFTQYIETERKKTRIYDSLRDKFIGTNFSPRELNIVRDQYFDMNDDQDRSEYHRLLNA